MASPGMLSKQLDSLDGLVYNQRWSSAEKNIPIVSPRRPAQNITEVIDVSGEELWEVFRETGDPICWLWSRRSGEINDEDNTAGG